MSPLVSAPTRGYADWQRVGNYDTDIEWNVPGTFGAASINSPVIDVSRFAYLGGRIGELSTQCAVTVVWWSDAAASVAVGSQTFQLDVNIQHLMQLRLPNLGPFVTISVNPIGGVGYTFFARILATNRPHPLQVMPVAPVIIDRPNVAVAGAGTVIAYPVDYYAGSVSVWVSQSIAQASFLTLRYLSIDGTYHNAVQVSASAMNQTFAFTVPPGAWRLDFASGPSAQNVTVVATYSMTGAT